jgi:hypothetical protein
MRTRWEGVDTALLGTSATVDAACAELKRHGVIDADDYRGPEQAVAARVRGELRVRYQRSLARAAFCGHGVKCRRWAWCGRCRWRLLRGLRRCRFTPSARRSCSFARGQGLPHPAEGCASESNQGSRTSRSFSSSRCGTCRRKSS